MSDDAPLMPEDPFEKLRASYEENWKKMLDSKADVAAKVRATIEPEMTAVAAEQLRLALHASNERIRLQAGQFLLDRMVFKNLDDEDALASWIKQLQSSGADIRNTTPAGQVEPPQPYNDHPDIDKDQ